MSGFEHGSIDRRNARRASHARLSTDLGEIAATVTCIDADWERWIGTYSLRIVNGTDLVLFARVRDAIGIGVPVRPFCVFERTMSIPIAADGIPKAIDVEGTAIAFSIDVPLPERGPQPRQRGTTTGTVGS